MEDGRAGTGWCNTDASPIVAVTIRQQAEAGRGPHFDEGKRLGQCCQQRQQDGTARGLVGLGGAPEHRGTKFGGAVCDHVAERRNIGRATGDQGRRPQQQVGLASRRRQVDQEAQDIDRSRDVLCQALIVQRDSPGFVGCEPAIALRETGQRFLKPGQ